MILTLIGILKDLSINRRLYIVDGAVYFIFDLVSSTISQNCHHCEVLPLSCPINVTSSSSCVFILCNSIALAVWRQVARK